MTSNIELSKNRDFGEIITDTFIFTRQNLKPLLKCFFIFCGFFIVASIFLGIIQETKTISAFNNNQFQGPFSSVFTTSRSTNIFGIEYFLVIIFMIFNYAAMPVTIYSYIALYKEKGNIPPTPTEVWGYFKYFYFKILGGLIIVSILLILGFVFCLIPGIYLFPILTFIFPIMIFENTSFSYAFNRSFKLIKDNWWPTFGVFIIIGLIVYVALLVVILPTTVLNMGSMFLHPDKGMHLSLTLTIISNILQHLCLVFFIVPTVTVSLCYFNLNEKTENTGLLTRLNNLGNTNTNNSLPAEEY
jgi:hypothetical protein